MNHDHPTLLARIMQTRLLKSIDLTPAESACIGQQLAHPANGRGTPIPS